MTQAIMEMFKKCEADYKKAHTPYNYSYGSGTRTYTYRNGQLVLMNSSTKQALAKATKVLNGLSK